MFDVSSSFKSEVQGRTIEPVRRFYISNSDYSDRVQKWPKIKRDASQLKSISLSVNLANVDGGMNEFYRGQYKLKDKLKFTMGVPDADLDYSEVFSDYTFSNMTRGVTSEDYIKLTEDTTSSFHYVLEPFNGLEQNTDLYFDVKLKSAGKNIAAIVITDNILWPYMNVYLDNGSYTDPGVDEVFYRNVTSEADGFWRATIGARYDDITSVQAVILLINSDGSQAYDGDGTSGIWAGDATLKGTEAIDLYTGEISKVSYSKNDCVIKTRDKLWGFAQKVVGESDTPVKIPPSSQYLISDIAWTLCTCYGGLDSTANSSNPDINYESFETWAEQFSVDNVFAQTNYEGTKVISGLTNLARMSDSAIWIEGDGKLHFKRFVESSSTDIVFTNDEMADLEIDIDMDRLINKQWVYFDYVPDDDLWASSIVDVRSSSVNTFGLREDVLKDESIWYVDSVSALNVAVRKSYLNNQPNRKFNYALGLPGIYTQKGDNVRLVNSFYDLTSSEGWIVEAVEYDMHGLKNRFYLDEALPTQPGFYLDVSTLDGDHILL